MTLGYAFKVELARGDQADAVVWDFAYTKAIAPTSTDFANWVDNLEAGLNNVPTGGVNQPVDYLNGNILRGADVHTVKMYTVPDAAGPLGSPTFTGTMSMDAYPGTGISMPEECAIVLSFNADLSGIFEEVGATRPRQRRRGRVFFGPVQDSADNVTAGVTGSVRVNSTCTTDLALFSEEALKDTMAADSWIWCVWSRTDWAMRPVVAGHIDNAFDTIRHRGAESSARVEWS